jgi:hypothetical protein
MPDFRPPDSAAPPTEPSPQHSPNYKGRKPPPEKPGRRWYTPEKAQRKLDYWEKIGRRCDGNNRRCLSGAATVEFTVRNIDPATGKPAGDPYTVRSCGRHRIQFLTPPGTRSSKPGSYPRVPPDDAVAHIGQLLEDAMAATGASRYFRTRKRRCRTRSPRTTSSGFSSSTCVESEPKKRLPWGLVPLTGVPAAMLGLPAPVGEVIDVPGGKAATFVDPAGGVVRVFDQSAPAPE